MLHLLCFGGENCRKPFESCVFSKCPNNEKTSRIMDKLTGVLHLVPSPTRNWKLGCVRSGTRLETPVLRSQPPSAVCWRNWSTVAHAKFWNGTPISPGHLFSQHFLGQDVLAAGGRMSDERTNGRTQGLQREVGRREVILILLCVVSDVLPRMLASFLDSNSALWRALVDNACHAGIAAASWMVVASLSHPPSPAGFLATLPGSPLHRCLSGTVPRVRHQKRTNARTDPSPAKTASALAVGEYNADTTVGLSTELPPRAQGGRRLMMREAFIAACIGSLLDVDHFLAAGSFRLSQATGLSNRPWCHSVVALFVAALVTSILTYNRRAAAAVFSAGASHQLRDATRRGLWLYPPRGPKTPPLRYPVYLLAQALLPLVVALYLRWDIGAGCTRFFRGIGRRRRSSAHRGDAFDSINRRGNDVKGNSYILAI
ncbi:unnamed protein product [Laminaria digitata]